MRASRITYVGELGWELYVPTEFVQNVFDVLIEAGRPHGLKLAGYHALNSLRMEKAYRHWGHDITDEDTPFEAGLGFAVAFDNRDFIGREALLRRRGSIPKRRLVQFALSDPDAMLYHNEPVWRDGSPGRAHHLRDVRAHRRPGAGDGLCRGGGRSYERFRRERTL